MTSEKKNGNEKNQFLSRWDALSINPVERLTPFLWRHAMRAWFCVFLLVSFVILLPVSAEITKAERDEVGKELACLCDTCPRRPLDECTCGYAQKQQARIEGLLGTGETKQQVVDAFVAEFGLRVLSKPPTEGFSLAAWLMPPIFLLVGFFIVRTVLRTWSHSKPTPLAATEQSILKRDPYLGKLEQELRERES
jgi:cytochrome c-type biogenesis protein CcmH